MFLYVYLCDHPLEDVAATNSLKNFCTDCLGDAVQTFFDKRFTLH